MKKSTSKVLVAALVSLMLTGCVTGHAVKFDKPSGDYEVTVEWQGSENQSAEMYAKLSAAIDGGCRAIGKPRPEMAVDTLQNIFNFLRSALPKFSITLTGSCQKL